VPQDNIKDRTPRRRYWALSGLPAARQLSPASTLSVERSVLNSGLFLQLQVRVFDLVKTAYVGFDYVGADLKPRGVELGAAGNRQVFGNNVGTNLDLSRTGPMPVRAVLFDSRNPVLLARFEIKVVSLDALSAAALQGISIEVDSVPAFRELNLSDPGRPVALATGLLLIYIICDRAIGLISDLNRSVRHLRGRLIPPEGHMQ